MQPMGKRRLCNFFASRSAASWLAASCFGAGDVGREPLSLGFRLKTIGVPLKGSLGDQ